MHSVVGEAFELSSLRSGNGWRLLHGDRFVSFSEGTPRHGNAPYYKISVGNRDRLEVVGPGYRHDPEEVVVLFIVEH